VTEKNQGSLFDRLVEIMAMLRSPAGCPWDRAQDSTSLKPYLLEEAYEVLEAIEEGTPDKLKDELGDLLFQVSSMRNSPASAGISISTRSWLGRSPR
jgi:uncharacterized protein YabN with tetrapyrrole methylase and pyrophosphatase domain